MGDLEGSRVEHGGLQHLFVREYAPGHRSRAPTPTSACPHNTYVIETVHTWYWYIKQMQSTWYQRNMRIITICEYVCLSMCLCHNVFVVYMSDLRYESINSATETCTDSVNQRQFPAKWIIRHNLSDTPSLHACKQHNIRFITYLYIRSK